MALPKQTWLRSFEQTALLTVCCSLTWTEASSRCPMEGDIGYCNCPFLSLTLRIGEMRGMKATMFRARPRAFKRQPRPFSRSATLREGIPKDGELDAWLENQCPPVFFAAGPKMGVLGLRRLRNHSKRMSLVSPGANGNYLGMAQN